MRPTYVNEDKEAKRKAALAKADAACRKAHPKESRSLVPIEVVGGAVIYIWPGQDVWAVLWPIRKSEVAWLRSLVAARRAVQDKLKGAKLPGYGLNVAVEMQPRRDRFDDTKDKSGEPWAFGTLVDYDHPAVARSSRFYHRTHARVKLQATGEVVEVDLSDVKLCDNPNLLHKLHAALARKEAAKQAASALSDMLVGLHDVARYGREGRKASAKGKAKTAELPGLEDPKTLKRLAVAQKARRQRGVLRG